MFKCFIIGNFYFDMISTSKLISDSLLSTHPLGEGGEGSVFGYVPDLYSRIIIKGFNKAILAPSGDAASCLMMRNI